MREEDAGRWFSPAVPSPWMILTLAANDRARAEIPGAVHVDGTARVQTVRREENPLYWRLISSFHELTGVPMVVNTSFNDNDEPIVCSPDDALRCFVKTGLDGLAIGPFWVERAAAGQFAATVAA